MLAVGFIYGQEDQKIRFNHFRGKTGTRFNNNPNSEVLNTFWKTVLTHIINEGCLL